MTSIYHPSSDIAQALENISLKLARESVVPEIKYYLEDHLLPGGKMFRPFLCFLAAKIFDVPFSKAEVLGIAAEKIHSAFLAHDDVIDESDLRRGKQTLHKHVGNARAILAGDLLLSDAMLSVTELENIDIIKDISLVILECVNGEWAQLALKKKKSSCEFYELEQIAIRKTGLLFSWCFRSLAYLSNKPQMVQACTKIGNNLGVVFQIYDDILDYNKDSKKSYLNDLQEGLINFMGLSLCEVSEGLSEKIFSVSHETLKQTPLWSDFELTLARTKLQRRIDAHINLLLEALEEIKALGINETQLFEARSFFEGLPAYFEHRGYYRMSESSNGSEVLPRNFI